MFFKSEIGIYHNGSTNMLVTFSTYLVVTDHDIVQFCKPFADSEQHPMPMQDLQVHWK